MATEEENSPTPATEKELISPMPVTEKEKPAAEQESSPVSGTEEEEPLIILATEEEIKPSPAAGKEKPPMPAVKQEDSPLAAATEEENPKFPAVKKESFPVPATKEEEEEVVREQKRLRASSARNFPWAAVQSCKPRLTCTPPKSQLEFKVYDPCEGETREACFFLPDSSMFLEYNENALYLSRVHASKDGWVLVEEESPVGARTITLFNPFTGLDFPAPENFNNHRIAAATMTAGPDSADCILFVVFRCEKTGKNYLGTYRYAEELWDWDILMIPDSDAAVTVKGMVYCAGEAMLYFVYEDGKLWRFDYLDEFSTAIDYTEIAFPIDSLNLVEYEGEILLATRVILDTNQGLLEERYRWIVFKFNRDFMSWIQDGLHGMTLFLSATSFCVPASETIVVGNLEGCVCSFSGRFPRVYPVQRDREARWYVSLPTFYGCAHGGAGGSDQQSFWIEAPVLEEEDN